MYISVGVLFPIVKIYLIMVFRDAEKAIYHMTGEVIGDCAQGDARACFQEAIEAELRDKIPAAMEGGGYIYHSDHSIPPEVSLETYLHAMKVLDEIGSYE